MIISFHNDQFITEHQSNLIVHYGISTLVNTIPYNISLLVFIQKKRCKYSIFLVSADMMKPTIR